MLFPRYPDRARASGEEALVVTAFVIDTSGAVERPSITLLSPANREFDDAVCKTLARVRFAMPTPARRALLVLPFEFGLGSPHRIQPALDWVELAQMLDALPRAEMAARLTAERHCG
jgi:TonB family protein